MHEKRRYPRFPFADTEKIVYLDNDQTPKQHVIYTENLSTSGLKFTAGELIKPETQFLLTLKADSFSQTGHKKSEWLSSGDYYLTQVKWAQALRPEVFAIGAAFLEKKYCRAADLDTLTELINIKMLEMLPDTYKHL